MTDIDGKVGQVYGVYAVKMMLVYFTLFMMALIHPTPSSSDGYGLSIMHTSVLATGTFHQGNMHNFSHPTQDCCCSRNSYTAGVQCLANSIVAIAYTQQKDITSWKQTDMDSILCQGDMIYRTISTVPRLLEISDIPSLVTLFDTDFRISYGREYHCDMQIVRIIEVIRTMSISGTCNAIIMMGDHRGAAACSLHYQHQKYFVCDAHARSGKTGLLHPNGSSVLVQCNNTTACALFLETLGNSLHASQFSFWTLEMKKMKQSVTTTSMSKQEVHGKLSAKRKNDSLFCDLCGQVYTEEEDHSKVCAALSCMHCKQTFDTVHNTDTHETVCKQRKVHGKLSPKRKDDSLFCDLCGQMYTEKEDHSKVCAALCCMHCKQTFDTVHNTDKHEAVCKKRRVHGEFKCLSCHRSFDNEYNKMQHQQSCQNKVKKATLTKQQCARLSSLEATAQHQMDQLRTLDRQLNDLRAKLRMQDDHKQTIEKKLQLSKQCSDSRKIRVNEVELTVVLKHVSILNETIKKLTARKTEIVLQQKTVHEKIVQLKVQENIDNRHHCDKTGSIQNKVSNQSVNQQEQHTHSKNAVRKRKQRENPEYRQKEATVKRKCRENAEYRQTERQKDATNRCKQRENAEYRQKEATNKRKLRDNVEYRQNERQKDASNKRKLRENAEHRQEEATNKRRKRMDPQVREHDTAYKRQRRTDPEYRLSEATGRNKALFGRDLTEAIQIFREDTSNGPDYKCASCMQMHFKSHMTKLTDAFCMNHRHRDLLRQCVAAHIKVENTKWQVTFCTPTDSWDSDKPITCVHHKSFDGQFWLCSTCATDILHGLIPRQSTLNIVGFPPQPPQLQLHPMEETLISPLLPFMVVRSLPVCGVTQFGQKQIIGNVVHVPNAIDTTVKELPRDFDSMGTIAVNLKRKKAYKHAVFSENIRPANVLTALQYLVQHSSFYHKFQIAGQEWIDNIGRSTHTHKAFVEGHATTPEENSTIDDRIAACEPQTETDDQLATDEMRDDSVEDEFEEVDAADITQGNMDTMLTENIPIRLTDAHLQDIANHDYPAERVLNLAPGEGQIPVYREPDAEYMAYPAKYCGLSRPSNKERHRPVQTSTLFRAELRHSDSRVWSSISNIFWKTKHMLERHLVGLCNFALRRIVGPRTKKYTAGELCDPKVRENILCLDEGFKFMRHVRGSPPYFEDAQKKVKAMVRQLQKPTLFFSLSAADTNWPSLLQSLGQHVDKQTYTKEYIENDMTFDDKCRLVAAHPVLCSRYFHERVQKFVNIILKGHHSPLYAATKHVYRVEFQKRGSPHVHGLLWIDKAPRFNVDTNEDIVKYIDSCISCSLDVPEEHKKYVKLQVHRHSRTCKIRVGGKNVCRFGIPRFPMRNTAILEPLLDEDTNDREMMAKHLDAIQEKMKKLPDDIQTFDEWLQYIEMDEDMYIKVVRSSLQRTRIFLKRQPTETRVNNYMKHLLDVWQGNHDIQFVLDEYQCITYICDYMTKAQKGMSELLRAACEEAKAGNMDVKESVRHITNVFINAAETPVQECCFDLLGLFMVKSSVQSEFINTSPFEKRVAVMKSVDELEQMRPQSQKVTKNSNIERYTMRPKKLHTWTLADYVSWISIKYTGRSSSVKDDDQNHENTDDDTSEEDCTEDDIFPYAMPNGIVLNKRKEQKIIRFVNYRLKSEPEQYYRERVMLYTAWKNEERLLDGFATYKDVFYHHKELISEQMAIYEPAASMLAEAEEQYEREHQDDIIMPPTENSTHGDMEIPPEHQFDIGPSIGLPQVHIDPEVELIPKFLPDKKFYELIGSLNMKQLEFFTHVMHQALQGQGQTTCALHGGAGTGKSHVIKAVYQGLHRILSKQPGKSFDTECVVLAAPTGKAAYNIRGSTIHRVFHIAANQKMVHKPLSSDLLNTARRQFHSIQWIIIDEFSMVGNRMLRFIHLRLQEIKGNRLPFGGLNLVFVGDLYQLKPVMQDYIFELVREEYGQLATNLWTKYFVIFEIDEVMRQKGDKDFALLLNRLREGKQTVHDIEVLKTRCITQDQADEMSSVPHFFPTKAQRDSYNDRMLSKCEGQEVTSMAVDAPPSDVSKDVQQQILNAAKNKTDVSSTGNLPYMLTLKVGQVYDVTANVAVEDGIINGAECTVMHFECDTNNETPYCVWVQFTEETIGKEVRRMCARKYQQHVSKGWTPILPIHRTFTVKRSQTVKRQQFPLRLSSGRTIHVSQSSTYKEIVVDMKTDSHPPRHFFEHMHYVAFSRCTSLSGLHIVNINEDNIRASPRVHDYLHNQRSTMQLSFLPPYKLQDHLRIAYNNVCSLQHKWPAVSQNHLLLNCDVFILAETWFSSTDSDTAYQLDGFNCHRMDSTVVPSRRGMIVYVRNDIPGVTCKCTQTPVLEICELFVRCTTRYIRVIGVYKPPSTTMSQLYAELSQILSTCDKAQQTIIIGDFNLDVMLDTTASFLTRMLVLYDLTQLIKDPTTYTGTAIDLVFSNIANMNAFPLTNTWSTHHTLFVYIPHM